MESFPCSLCDQVFDKQKGLRHHLYVHLSRVGDIEPKENDQYIGDRTKMMM